MTIKGLVKKTKAANAAFAKLSKPQKRVAIAKDVLAAIAAKRIKPTHGEYLSVPAENDWNFVDEQIYANPKGEFQDLIPKLPACQVCAKGALFLCTVVRRDKVKNEKVGISWAGNTFSRQLGNIFTTHQLDSIEDAFEDSLLSGPKAMKMVMKNIVKNKGTYVPVKEKGLWG